MSADSRVVLVTGGSRGIGRAIVEALVSRGVHVGCGYATSKGPAEELALGHPGKIAPVRYVLGDAASARDAVAETIHAYGHLDAVIANAGVWAGGLLGAMPDAEWEGVVDDNLHGIAQLVRAALPKLRGRPEPSITIISSVIGVIGGPGDTAYAAAKAGLIGFGRALSKEVARDGIRVNTVAPGFVETDMTLAVSDNARQKIKNSTLLGRFGTAVEIASAAVYLSEDASYCTGSLLTVDGGWSL